MQNNITELTQRLLRALDSNYNVSDMETVTEVIRLLENVSITKELLETTRLGKHVNELRKNTSCSALAKRAKELLKQWRSKILVVPPPDTNGQLKPVPSAATGEEQLKKRPAKERPEQHTPAKRQRVNGASEYEFSDNSNSSFKDAIVPKNVILINSDSNSSMPDVKNEPVLEEQQPKKRGRKKGSKNHRNLLDEAESSFTSKMAVSRGNAKVKTTQELIAGLQNRNNAATTTTTSPAKNMEDWNERAAKLTERVSLIDQKLNASANRMKKKKQTSRVLESGTVTNVKVETVRPESPDEDEIVVVDDEQDSPPAVNTEEVKEEPVETTFVPSLSVEEALSRLPPIDSSLHELDDHPCICVLHECTGDDVEERFTFTENPECPARLHLDIKCPDVITQERCDEVHTNSIESVNGNFGVDTEPTVKKEESDDINIVPNFYELSPKQVDRDSVCENYKKYSISDCDKFREYHEVLDRPSYNGDILRILPYVVID